MDVRGFGVIKAEIERPLGDL